MEIEVRLRRIKSSQVIACRYILYLTFLGAFFGPAGIKSEYLGPQPV